MPWPEGRGCSLITQVGDTGFRVNGGEVHTEQRLIDVLDARTRASSIKLAIEQGVDVMVAIELGREYITPSLQSQHRYRNNPDHWLGFAYIDGGDVPEKFIKVYRFPLADVHTLDGYAVPPSDSTVAAWEEMNTLVEAEDPQRYMKYLATKPKDDRTVAVINF